MVDSSFQLWLPLLEPLPIGVLVFLANRRTEADYDHCETPQQIESQGEKCQEAGDPDDHTEQL